MERVLLLKAVGDQPTQDLNIVITGVELGLLRQSTSKEDLLTIYDTQAKSLVDALSSALPEGTIEALLRQLLLRRASTNKTLA